MRWMRSTAASLWIAILPVASAQGTRPPAAAGLASQQAGTELAQNGDFEQHGGSGCLVDLSNAAFNALVAHVIAFGDASEVDLLADAGGCGGLPGVVGATKCGLRRESVSSGGRMDALAVPLVTPLAPGDHCIVSVWANGQTQSGSLPLGRIEVGLSSSPTEFGVPVLGRDLQLAGQWEQLSLQIAVHVAATHVTIRETRHDAWTHVDGVSVLQNDLGTEYCSATTNSTGAPADIGAFGSESTSAGDLTLTASPVPDQPGIFFHAANATQTTFGNGYLCATGNVARGAVIQVSGRLARYSYDHSDAQHELGPYAGATRYFQYWFRDPMAGGALFNRSNAVAIALTP